MRNRFVIVSALVAALALPAISAVPGLAQGELTRGDVDAALERRRAASASLEALTSRFEKAMADEEILRERIADLAREVSRLEQEIGARRVEVRELVKERYMAGGSTGTERVFAVRTFTDIPVQTEYFALINARDISMLRGLETAEALHVESQELLAVSLTDQQVLVGELTALADELSRALADADAEYATVAVAYEAQEAERIRREEERRRQEEAAAERAREAAAAVATTTTVATVTTVASVTTTTNEPATTTTTEESDASTTTTAGVVTTTTTTIPAAPPPVVTDGKTCPVNAATSFSDTWGAPRSGGRTHEGVDMVAARNAPIVAIESGTVTRTSNSSLGGLSIYLTGASGSRYYYAHLEYIADGIRGGTAVSVGDLLGGNGSSGNAPDWLPHLHFQYAPPGSGWVNPYPLVKALCG
ncbi:MAG TPA: peptidoglycan DD-metalloendopeptidase family protein [Acidimicrobiia bacterium]|nr:peptidoglycan DD-metalloendopeptidase family protein [Acidimicrobiia bacterium]